MTSTIPFTIGHGAVIGGLMSNPSGERLYDSIPSAFAKDEEVGFFGARLCEALTAMFQDMDQIVRDTPAGFDPIRSEEHTSELQSLRHLVCRLLLEKKH